MQDVPLRSAFHETLAGMGSALPRLGRANRSRVREPGADPGQLFEVVSVRAPQHASVRVGDDDERTLELDPSILPHLEPGDRLRGRLENDGGLTVYCCYPPEVAELAPS